MPRGHERDEREDAGHDVDGIEIRLQHFTRDDEGEELQHRRDAMADEHADELQPDDDGEDPVDQFVVCRSDGPIHIRHDRDAIQGVREHADDDGERHEFFHDGDRVFPGVVDELMQMHTRSVAKNRPSLDLIKLTSDENPKEPFRHEKDRAGANACPVTE